MHANVVTMQFLSSIFGFRFLFAEKLIGHLSKFGGLSEKLFVKRFKTLVVCLGSGVSREPFQP